MKEGITIFTIRPTRLKLKIFHIAMEHTSSLLLLGDAINRLVNGHSLIKRTSRGTHTSE